MKIQLHIKNDQAFGADAEWEEVDPEVWVDLINLNEAAPTNCVVWVSVHQIRDVVFFIHAKDCEDSTYGSILGRDSHFFVRKEAIFSGEGNNFVWGEDIAHETYLTFGHDTSDPYTSMSERYLITLYHFSLMNKRLLVKGGRTGVRAALKSFAIRDGIKWVISKLAELVAGWTSNATSAFSKHVIVRGNMSIESKHVRTSQMRLTATTGEQFDAFSSVIGVKHRRRSAETSSITRFK